MTERRYTRIAFVALLIIGALARIFGAWAYRACLNPDAGVVALMAKHMAEGVDFPVFFYGQAYMGSFEPAVSALMCFLLGPTGFAVCLGTAIVAFLLLPAVYVWGRDAGGEKAGLAAMLYCIVGPGGYWHYTGSPRGGYPLTLVLGATVIWLSGKIISRELAGKHQSGWWFLLLGLLAGLGWWTNQLITAALLTCALLFVIFWRRRILTWRIVPGLVGFFLGGLPFWVWNAQNNWATFNFMGSIGQTPFLLGLKLFFEMRLLQVLDIPVLPTWGKIVVAVLYLYALAVLGWVLVRATMRKQFDEGYVHRLAVVLFVVVSALVFSSSHFAQFDTPRYLLPMVPAVAVIVGLATAQLSKRLPRGTAWIPLTLLVLTQAHLVVPASLERGSVTYRKWMQDLHELGDFLREQEVEIVYSRYGAYSRNFLFGEEFCFTTPRGDRYPAYARKAEATDQFAFLRCADDLTLFVMGAGGSFMSATTGKVEVAYDFKAPEAGWEPIDSSRWEHATTESGREIQGELNDNHVDTFIKSPSEPGTEGCIYITLTEPTVISGVRLVNRSCGLPYPHNAGVFGRLSDKEEWRPLMGRLPLTGFFWSGPRFYAAGIRYRAERRFKPREVKQIRICLPWSKKSPEWAISEIQLFGPGSRPDWSSGLDKLTAAIDERGIKHVYSDRYVAAKLNARYGDDLLTEVEPDIFGLVAPDPAGAITLSAQTALLVTHENVAVCRTVLSQRKVSMRETVIGPWVMFDFGAEDWREEYAQELGLYWAGFGCLLADNKRWALTLVGRGDTAGDDPGGQERSVELFREALDVYPHCPNAMERLASALREQGKEEEAAEIEKVSHRLWTPELPAYVRFKNGVEFLGVTAEPVHVSPGDEVAMRYYWKCPEDVTPRDLAVFVHFQRDENLMQNDHVFLEHFQTECQQYPEIFVEEETLKVPEDIKAGVYTMTLGLYERSENERLAAKSELPVESDAVRVPLNIEVISR